LQKMEKALFTGCKFSKDSKNIRKNVKKHEVVKKITFTFFPNVL